MQAFMEPFMLTSQLIEWSNMYYIMNSKNMTSFAGHLVARYFIVVLQQYCNVNPARFKCMKMINS